MLEVLIVEDEAPIRDLLSMNLTRAGYHCTTAADGLEAATLLESHTYDLALLDIMLPKVNGYELLEYIRPMGIPVIFLTAKTTVDDRVKGLLAGAEDYLTKPFAMAELQARMEVVLRRFHKVDSRLTYEDMVIDIDSRQVTTPEGPVALTPKEFDLFVLLVRNRGVALFRSRIFQIVWEADIEGDTRTLDLHIQRLRKKLHLEDKLKTVYRIGYRLD